MQLSEKGRKLYEEEEQRTLPPLGWFERLIIRICDALILACAALLLWRLLH